MAKTKVRKPAARPARSSGTRLRRGIGRPPAGAANAVGREALINKACELLSRMPAAQVTRAEVARSLGVDPSLIRYYFRDRSTLMLAAVERMTSRFLITADQEAGHSSDESPAEALRAQVKALLRLSCKYPHFHRLITEELAGMTQPAARELLEKLTQRGIGSCDHMARRGKQAGRFRDFDVRLLFIAIVGLTEFFVTGSQIVRIAMGRDRPCDEALLEHYGDFICDLILHGIQSPVRK